MDNQRIFVEIRPFSQDGEEMLRATILPYGGDVIQVYPEKDYTLAAFPSLSMAEKVKVLPGYEINILDKCPIKEVKSVIKEDRDTEISSEPQNMVVRQTKSSRLPILETDPFYLLFNIDFFGPIMCLFLISYGFFCVIGFI